MASSATRLHWQSKLVLLLQLPLVSVDVLLEGHWWATQAPPVAIWTLGLSALLGLAAWKIRAATPGAAATGAVITASLMFASVTFPYRPWQTGLIPVLGVMALAAVTTRLGRSRKEKLGIAESRKGRRASQVAANLGLAALVSNAVAQSWYINSLGLSATSNPLFAVGLAALAEAAADTVSSELGQVLSSRPRMLTTFRLAEPGTDGAISLGGTFAGMCGAAIVAAGGAFAMGGDLNLFLVAWIGGVFGLFFDSLLGATIERRGWLNNDAVNFLSTLSASVCALVVLKLVLPHHGIG